PPGEDRISCRHAIADDGQPSERAEYETTNRRIVLVGHTQTKPLVQFADVRRAGDDDNVRAFTLRRFRRLVVLVEDLTNDLLAQIFHRHHARRTAVFIENDRHVLFQTLEIGEDLFDFPRAGLHVDGLDDGPYG